MMKPAHIRIKHYISLLKNQFQFLKSIYFILNKNKESMEKIIKYITAAVILHNFLISENNESNYFFDEEDNCLSDIDANNGLNCPVNDESDEQECHNQMTAYFCEKYM